MNKFDQRLIYAPYSACAQCLIATDWAAFCMMATLRIFDSFARFDRRDKLLQHLSLTGGGVQTSLG